MTQSEAPFISVVVPTKNRSHLVKGAIESVLSQSFGDFEVVLVDNDDSNSTAEVVAQIQDPRVKYFRTGGMSMVENWEFGRRQCTGKYLTVLEDKLTYYPLALEKIHQLVAASAPEVIVWGIGEYDKKYTANFDIESQVSRVDSESILDDYVRGKETWRRIPRIINSCVSASLVNHIVELNQDGSFFRYASPDLVAAFTQLAIVDYVYVVPTNLEYQRSRTSASSGLRVNKQKAVSYYSGKSSFNFSDVVSLVPVKNQHLVQNTVYNDFLSTRNRIGGKLEKYSMSDYVYARMCVRDIYSTLFRGGAIGGEIRDVSEFMRKTLPFHSRLKLWAWWFKLVTRKALAVFVVRPLKRKLSA